MQLRAYQPAVGVGIGRPRGFDEDVALEAATRVVREKSYEGAAIADLTETMGINRFSMYAAFGGFWRQGSSLFTG